MPKSFYHAFAIPLTIKSECTCTPHFHFLPPTPRTNLRSDLSKIYRPFKIQTAIIRELSRKLSDAAVITVHLIQNNKKEGAGNRGEEVVLNKQSLQIATDTIRFSTNKIGVENN